MVTEPVGVQSESPSARFHLPGLPEAMGPDGGCQNQNWWSEPPSTGVFRQSWPPDKPAVCIATPGSARINVAYRLYSVDELYWLPSILTRSHGRVSSERSPRQLWPSKGVPKGQCPNQMEPLTCRMPSHGAPSICDHSMVTQPAGVQGESPSAWCHLPGLLGQNVRPRNSEHWPHHLKQWVRVGCHDKTEGMSPPAWVSSNFLAPEQASCRVAVEVCWAKSDCP